jgi:hypothetical protein
MDWRYWHRQMRGWDLSERPVVAIVEVGLLRIWFAYVIFMSSVWALCLTLLIAPSWPISLITFWIDWYQNNWAVHCQLEVTTQIRLAAVLGAIIVLFLLKSSFRWLQVRFFKTWFACAVLLFGALTLCVTLFVAPWWPIEVVRLYPFWVERYQNSWAAHWHVGGDNQIRLAAAFAIIIVRNVGSSSFGWIHHKLDGLATFLEGPTPKNPQRITEPCAEPVTREIPKSPQECKQAIVSELRKVCAHLDERTHAAALIRHLTTKTIDNEDWSPTTSELSQELGWVSDTKYVEGTEEWELGRYDYLRFLKCQLKRKLSDYYQTDEGRAATVKISLQPRRWRPTFEFRPPGNVT